MHAAGTSVDVHIAPPEPDLTPDELLHRAAAMRQTLRTRQEACEKAGRILDETNDEFIKAGFYRILQPRCFGGYEFDLPVFMRVMIEVARGCSESGWVLALTAGHAVIMALMSETAQREAFGATGEFRAPGVAMPTGIAAPTADGYRVSGAWDYASGCDTATHFLGASLIQEAGAKVPKGMILALFDRADYEVVDNWNVIGMQGTGSRRVVVKERFVPEHRVFYWTDAQGAPVRRQPGHNLYRNGLYHGPIVPLLISEVASVCVGTARGALDIYEEILRSKRVTYPPFQYRFQESEFQRHFGEAQSLVDTAEAALLKMGADYMEHGRRHVEDGVEISEEAERRLLLIEQQCVRLTWEAVELMFRTAGTSSATKSAPLGRYFRNLAVVRTHLTLQSDHTAGNAARLHFGFPPLSRL
jgi:3-hydroxy-9,10-secoandrosta-1,3,5(10)-triene-9,17-dione monooxygenase